MADSDVMYMTHPDHLPGTPPMATSEFAFKEQWAAKGWQRVEEKPRSSAAKSSRRAKRQQ